MLGFPVDHGNIMMALYCKQSITAHVFGYAQIWQLENGYQNVEHLLSNGFPLEL